MKCVACKNKKSNERCLNRPLGGLLFCGQHVKSKSTRNWYDVNKINEKVTLISKIWKGYHVRNRLKLAGPGVLNRSQCHNEEELVLSEPKEKIHPFDYFAFKEDEKIWWFDIRSFISLFRSALNPTNPYTRQPLSAETRSRARLIYKYRFNNKLPLYHQPFPKMTLEQLVENQWMRVCQNVVECGFDDIRPELLMSLNKTKIFIVLTSMMDDMHELALEHPKTSKRYRYLRQLRFERHYFFIKDYPILNFAGTLLSIFNDTMDPFHIAFSFVSAISRL